MPKMRIHELVNELGVSKKDIVDKLAEMGYPVRDNAFSSVEGEVAGRLIRVFKFSDDDIEEFDEDFVEDVTDGFDGNVADDFIGNAADSFVEKLTANVADKNTHCDKQCCRRVRDELYVKMLLKNQERKRQKRVPLGQRCLEKTIEELEKWLENKRRSENAEKKGT